MVYGRTYSKTIIWQNDVTSAPPVTSDATPSPYVVNAKSPTFVAAEIIVRQNALEQIVYATPVPLVVNPMRLPVQRGVSILAAAAAEVYFSGSAFVITSMPKVTARTTTIVQVNPLAVTPEATDTAKSVIVTSTRRKVALGYISIHQPFDDVVVPPGGDVFGSLGSTRIIGVLRITSVISLETRTTTTYSPTRLSRIVGLVRNTMANAVVRLTRGRTDVSSTDTRGEDRTTEVN